MIIKELDANLVHRANSNSFNGTRGDGTVTDYNYYAEKIISWTISDEKKQKLLDELHKKFSEKLKYESQHVSVMVAGPSKYNAKKLDKSDQILSLSADISKWFNELERQIENSTKLNRKAERLIGLIESARHNEIINPVNFLIELSSVDNAKFIELYEEFNKRFKWRKNSTIYKLYEKSKNGEIKNIEKIIIFEDANFTAYTEGARAYIKFILKPKRQLIVALKSRKWWWNSRAGAWSTYLEKLDVEWVKSISSRYANYI